MKKKIILIALIAIFVVAVYLTLGSLGVIPTFKCGSSMGINGNPVGWCDWVW